MGPQLHRSSRNLGHHCPSWHSHPTRSSLGGRGELLKVLQIYLQHYTYHWQPRLQHLELIVAIYLWVKGTRTDQSR